MKYFYVKQMEAVPLFLFHTFIMKCADKCIYPLQPYEVGRKQTDNLSNLFLFLFFNGNILGSYLPHSKWVT